MPTRDSETGYALTLFGASVPLQERAIVGRDPACEVHLANDALVSRHHARLVVCAHGVVIEDLNSTNGVYVDGERVSGSRLLAGSESIRVGGTVLLLSCVSCERHQGRLEWDDVTVNARQPSSSSGMRPLVKTGPPAGIFEILSDLAAKALLAGDAELAGRIVEARRVDRADLANYLRAVAESAERLAPKDRLHLCRVESLARMRRTG